MKTINFITLSCDHFDTPAPEKRVPLYFGYANESFTLPILAITGPGTFPEINFVSYQKLVCDLDEITYENRHVTYCTESFRIYTYEKLLLVL